MIWGIHMSMGHEYSFLVQKYRIGIAHTWKLQDHLINFRFTVSADCCNVIFDTIHDFNDFLWCIICRYIVAWSMVEDIPKAKDLAAVMMGICIQHELGPMECTMDI